MGRGRLSSRGEKETVRYGSARDGLATEAAAAAGVVDRTPPGQWAPPGNLHSLTTVERLARRRNFDTEVKLLLRRGLSKDSATCTDERIRPQSPALAMADATTAAGDVLPVIRFSNLRHAALAS